MTTLVSIGHLAGELRVPVVQIEAIAKQLGIEPAYRIDGVPHYSAPDVERLAEVIRNHVGDLGIGDRRRIY